MQCTVTKYRVQPYRDTLFFHLHSLLPVTVGLWFMSVPESILSSHIIVRPTQAVLDQPNKKKKKKEEGDLLALVDLSSEQQKKT